MGRPKKKEVKVVRKVQEPEPGIDPVTGKSLNVMGIVKKNKQEAGMCKE